MTLYELQRRAIKLDGETIIDNAIMANSKVFVSSIKEQLSSGIMVSNSGATYQKQYKNQKYKDIKSRMNPKAMGNVDLKYTGAFYNGIYLDINHFGVPALFSSDYKMEILTDYYGTGILNLGRDELDAISKKNIEPTIITAINTILGL